VDTQVLSLVERAADRLEPFPRRLMAAEILYIRSLTIASMLLTLRGEVAAQVKAAFSTTVKAAFPELAGLLEKGASMVECVIAAWSEGDAEARLKRVALLSLLIQTLYETSITVTVPPPRAWG